MIKPLIYLLLGSFLLLVGCWNGHSDDALSSDLIRAEAYMWDNPEAAWAILDTIKVDVNDAYPYATWCLLYTQAQNRNNVAFTFDSLIGTAVRYFEERDDMHRKATAWYYAGRVYADLRQPVYAAGFYEKARETASQTADHRLQYQIARSYGWLCLNQGLLSEAKVLLQEAYTHAVASGIDKYRMFALDYIGRYYAFNQQMDSAVVFLEQAVDLGREIGDSTSLITVLNDAAIALNRSDKYGQAIDYLNESIKLELVRNTGDLYAAYYNLGDLYRLIGQPDSATYYLHKALVGGDIYVLQSCYFYLSDISREAKDWKEAVRYADLFWQCTDSISQFTHHKEIAELHARIKSQQVENNNYRLRIEKNQIILIGLAALIGMLVLMLILMDRYRQKMAEKERFIQSIRRQLDMQICKFRMNEQEIDRNNEVIRFFTEQLTRRPEIEEQQKEQEEILFSVRDYNNSLQQDNQQLRRKIADTQSVLQAYGVKQIAQDQQVEKNKSLRKRIAGLAETLLALLKLTNKLKRTPAIVSGEQMQALHDELDMVYPLFAKRLAAQYPHLSDLEIQTCCLIKLRFSTSEIAHLSNISPGSVTKRKRRIRQEMQNTLPELWSQHASLDAYLWQY